MTTYIIYRVKNSQNNKSYVGQTSQTLAKRRHNHLSDAANGSIQKFHCAIREIGSDNFEWEEITKCSNSKDADELEKFYIDYYNAYEDGYNATIDGKGCFNQNPGNYRKSKRIRTYKALESAAIDELRDNENPVTAYTISKGILTKYKVSNLSVSSQKISKLFKKNPDVKMIKKRGAALYELF